jgi:hypothetical protein
MSAPTAATKIQNGTRTGTAVDRRVARLRELAQEDPATAQAETWAWFVEAGRRIQTDRDAALAELGELFRAGTPSEGIEGPTQGALVGFTLQPAFDRAVATFTTAWLPWAGKRFDTAAARGDNLLLRSARWPSKLLWPMYQMRDAGERLAAFDFETRVEAGAVDPDRQVLVIDYAPVDSNPALVIKSIRDELVEVASGAHLGKMLWRRGSGEDARYTLLAYFALKSRL